MDKERAQLEFRTCTIAETMQTETKQLGKEGSIALFSTWKEMIDDEGNRCA